LLKFIENYLAGRMVYGMFFLGRNFVSGLICTLKPKNFPKQPRFIPALFWAHQNEAAVDRNTCQQLSTIQYIGNSCDQ